MREQSLPGPTPFGRPSRDLFSFAEEWMPLNHGSYGSIPAAVAAERNRFLRASEARPELFREAHFPSLLAASRSAVAPLLGAHPDEVVLAPNATAAASTIFYNLPVQKGDTILHFSTVYRAHVGLLDYLAELIGIVPVAIPLTYPIEDDELVAKFRETATALKAQGKPVRAACFDTISSNPGVRVPWEALTTVCRELNILSVLDGAHGVGQIDLTHLGPEARPDFAVSDCHKWLFCPRGCAVIYVPFRNQHLIRSAQPTSHGYLRPDKRPAPGPGGPGTAVTAYFQSLFLDVGTQDLSNYCVVPYAIAMRQAVWGGEAPIRAYCHDLAQRAGARVAEFLGTEVLGDAQGHLGRCNLSNVRIPLRFGAGGLAVADGPALPRWFHERYLLEFNTFIVTFWDARNEYLFVRLSAQVYLEMADFEWAAKVILELCERLPKEWVHESTLTQ